MARYTHKDENGRYYIESKNGLLESDIKGRVYGEAINKFAELENLPTADVAEVVNGKWEEVIEPYHGCEVLVGYSCSECNAYVEQSVFEDKYFLKAYCGNCGAKMDGERKQNGQNNG